MYSELDPRTQLYLLSQDFLKNNIYVLNVNNVNHYTFNKLHPAGNVGVQIHHIDPIKNGNDTRWYLSLQDLNRMGKFFSTKEYPILKYVQNHLSLVNYCNIENEGVFHRALADAQMTAKLWLAMLEGGGEQYQCWDLPFSFINKLSKTPKKSVSKLLSQYRIEN